MPDLTEKFIASLAPREDRKQYDVYGPKQSGLGLCYSNGGARTWFVFWRDADGKNRRTSIGRHDQGVSVKEAKRRARTKLEEIAKEIKVGVNRPTERNAPTMGDLIDRYLEHAADHVAPSTLVQVAGITRRCFTLELRAQKLKDFDRGQIEELHGAIGRTRGKYAANAWYRLTRLMMNFAIDRKLLQTNPCNRVRLFEENKRTRHLSQAEAERLNAALLQEPDWRWRAYFPLLLITGLRRSELRALAWDRVDFDKRKLVIMQRKNKDPLEQPLLDGAMQILAGLPSREGGGYVFPGRRAGQPVNNVYDAWQRLRTRAGLPDLHLHDLRHSFASFLINANVPLFTVSKALGHRSLASSQRYSHIEHSTVRTAMEQGASMLMLLANPSDVAAAS